MRTLDKPKARLCSSRRKTKLFKNLRMKWSYFSKTATRRQSWRRMRGVTWRLVLSISTMKSCYWSTSTTWRPTQPFQLLKNFCTRFKSHSSREFSPCLRQTLEIRIWTWFRSITRTRGRLSTIRSLIRSKCRLRSLETVRIVIIQINRSKRRTKDTRTLPNLVKQYKLLSKRQQFPNNTLSLSIFT